MLEAAKCKTSGNEATAADPLSCIQAEAHAQRLQQKPTGAHRLQSPRQRTITVTADVEETAGSSPLTGNFSITTVRRAHAEYSLLRVRAACAIAPPLTRPLPALTVWAGKED